MIDMDAVLQQQLPIVAAPKFKDFEPLQESGDRFVVTDRGLVLESKRPWVRAIVPVTKGEPTRPIPFGKGPEIGVNLLCGRIPQELQDRFLQEARAALPNEAACWFTWNEHTAEFRYRHVEVLEHSPVRVRYARPDLDEGEHLIADVHSHGTFAAGFSSDDEFDDRGTLQVSIVFGNVDSDRPTYACVMRCLGVTLPGRSIRFEGA